MVPGAGTGEEEAAIFRENRGKGDSSLVYDIWSHNSLKFWELYILPLHWRGTPGMLQARGRDMARVRLMGIWKGTLPVTIRQRQPVPLLAMDLRELQQSVVGEVPFLVLLVMKFTQGLKVESIVGLHAVVICP